MSSSSIVCLFIYSYLNNASAVEHVFGSQNYISALSLCSSLKINFLIPEFVIYKNTYQLWFVVKRQWYHLSVFITDDPPRVADVGYSQPIVV